MGNLFTIVKRCPYWTGSSFCDVGEEIDDSCSKYEKCRAYKKARNEGEKEYQKFCNSR